MNNYFTNFKALTSENLNNAWFKFVGLTKAYTRTQASVILILAILLMWVGLSAFKVRTVMADKVIVYLQMPLTEKLAASFFSNPLERNALTTAFTTVYGTNNFQPIWLENGHPAAILYSLTQALQHAQAEGLNPDTYHLSQLKNLKAAINLTSNPAQIAQLEQLATASYLLYASHLYHGRVNPNQLDSMWHLPAKSLPLANYLQTALEKGNIEQSLQNLANGSPLYIQLKKELNNLHKIAAQGEWPVIANNLVNASSVSEKDKMALKNRLVLGGDFDTIAFENNANSAALQKGIQSFQMRHGLPATGKLNEKTLNALNVPVSKRIEQVELNLERLRWLPRRTVETLISVNIPDYKLQVLAGNKTLMQANVVVGKLGFTTPIFQDSLESIVFSPEWNVPNQIATTEILPQLQKNPGYLQKNNFLVYDSYQPNAKPINPYTVNWKTVNTDHFKYHFVQKANPKNALGAVKFLFPNAFNVYIHDTPAKHLFTEVKRAYSHGCIRLQNPAQLAAQLLKQDVNWSPAKIQEKMGLTESTKVTLKKAVKVEITYLTAFVQDGQLQFREDIYGYDQPQLKTLLN